jgi:hypothetical protein
MQEYFSKKLQFPKGYSFRIAFAVGHKTPHEYEFDRQVTMLA